MGQIRFFFLWPSGENSLTPQKRKTSVMHACQTFVIWFMIDWSWYTFHSVTIAWWKSHTTPREKHECVHEEEKHEYLNLFFQFDSLWCLLPHWQNQIIQNFKKTWIHFMNLKLLPSTVVDSHNNVVWMVENDSYHSLS